MEVRSNGGEDFAELGRRFKAAGENGAAIRKATTKAVQAKLAKIVDEQQRTARSMAVKGVKGRGTARRDQFNSKRKRALKGGHGLRASVARGIKSKVSYTGRKLGARITVDPKGLPQSQRKLPRYLNRPKGWRHPVWGNRERWVEQHGEPYFDDPIRRHRDEVRKAVQDEVNNVMRTLK